LEHIQGDLNSRTKNSNSCTS